MHPKERQMITIGAKLNVRGLLGTPNIKLVGQLNEKRRLLLVGTSSGLRGHELLNDCEMVVSKA